MVFLKNQSEFFIDYLSTHESINIRKLIKLCIKDQVLIEHNNLMRLDKSLLGKDFEKIVRWHHDHRNIRPILRSEEEGTAYLMWKEKRLHKKLEKYLYDIKWSLNKTKEITHISICTN